MAQYGVVNTERINGLPFSAKDVTQNVENGWAGHKGVLIENEREIYEFLTPDAESIKNKAAVLVAQWEDIPYVSGRFSTNYDQFYNEKGVAFRIFYLEVNDVFAVSDYTVDMLDPDAGLVPGNYVVQQAGNCKLVEVEEADVPSENVFVGKILDYTSTGFRTAPMFGINPDYKPVKMASIEVVKNG